MGKREHTEPESQLDFEAPVAPGDLAETLDDTGGYRGSMVNWQPDRKPLASR